VTLGQVWSFLGIALPALAALLVPMPSVDLAYQLRAGADILAGRGIPTVDTWTFTVAGTPWLDQQWGAQAVLAAVFQLGGWTGLVLLRAVLVGLAFALLLAAVRAAWSRASVRSGGSAVASSARTATLVVLAAFAVAAPALALRPQLFAIVLSAATLLILVQRAEHPRRLWLIPVFAALWANLHGSFPLAIVLVGLAWLDEATLLREPSAPGGRRGRLPVRLLGSTGLALIGFVAAVATLIAPFGIDGWRYIQNLAGNPAITSQVSEWRPPWPIDPAGFVFYLSLVVVLGVLAFRVRRDGLRPPARFVAPIATVLVFGALGVVTGRGLAWWALAAPVAVVSLQPGLRLADVRVPGLPALHARTAREASSSEARRSPLNGLVVGVLALAGVALLPLWRPVGPAGVPIGTLSHAPQGIAAYLRDELGQSRVWNPQPWGSWLEWAAPNHLYTVDSRIELFPPDLWDDVAGTEQGDIECGPWNYGVNAVVVAESQPRVRDALAAARAWEQAYRDAEGSIWVRSEVPIAAPGFDC
jgi:hypothetical protein